MYNMTFKTFVKMPNFGVQKSAIMVFWSANPQKCKILENCSFLLFMLNRSSINWSHQYSKIWRKYQDSTLPLASKFWKVSCFCLVSGTFLSAIWLPHGQVWAITEDTASINQSLFNFWHKGHQKPHNNIRSLSPANPLVGFELGTSWFDHKPLTHYATLPKTDWLELIFLLLKLNIPITIKLIHNKFITNSNQSFIIIKKYVSQWSQLQ